MRRMFIATGWLTLAWLTPSFAAESFPGDTPERFQLTIGGTQAVLDTQASLGTQSGGLNAMIVFEDLFDLPVHNRFFRAEGSWKFGRRSYLDLGYVNVDRAASRVIQEEVDFGRYTFQAGASVTAEFKSRFIYAAYRHAFLQVPEVHISGSVGVSAARMEAGLSAEGFVTDTTGTPVGGQVSEDAEFPLPVPLFGLQLDWALSRTFALQSHTRAIGIDLGKIRGGMIEAGVRVFWYFHPQASLGVGFDRLGVSLPRYETDDYTARFGYQIQGFSVYLRGAL